MRLYSYLSSLLLLVVFPNFALAQLPPVAGSDNAQPQSPATNTAPVIPENWRVLDDLKTGLEVRSPVVLQNDEEPDFVRQLVRVQWRNNDPIDLWIARPKLSGKAPVILYLYSYSDSSDRFHDNGWCKRATADGFAAVGFLAALTDYRFRARPLRQWFVSELPESLGSSVHDVQLILNYLASRGDMDMNRVGMFGMGSGASIALLAAHADPRIKTLDLLDPWGDWPEWFRDSPLVPENERPKYLTQDFLNSVAPLDPVAYLPSLKTQKLRLQQTLSEPVTPKAAKDRIAAALPDPDELVKYTNALDLMNSWKITGLSGWIKLHLRSPTPKATSDQGAALTGIR